MPVIALTQEMGSLAKEVAALLGETLNLSVMRNEVEMHVAEKTGLHNSVIRRLREGKAGFVERLTTDDRSMALYTAEEVFALADRGNVVLRGWGATCLLREVPHVVRVRITRSMAKRVEWLMHHLETDDAEFAEAEIRRSDAAHAARMHERFGVSWGDPVLYDLVLNTDRVSVESCAELIAQLTRRVEFQETLAGKQMLADMALEVRIEAALKDHRPTRDTEVTIKAKQGAVTLSGIVLNADERGIVEQVATGVDGVSSVANELRLMTTSRKFASAKWPSA